VSDSAERDARRQLEAALDAAGWNLRGVIPASRYDARVAAPWRPDPLDAFCERVAAEAAARLSGCCVLAHQQREGVFADLVALGVEAGLGVASRLSLLVHPVYGPWLSIRAAVLTPHRLELTTPLEGFDPCTGCPAPCADACHGGAVPPTGFRVDRCGETRAREPACDLRCDARRACVVGPEHAYEAGAEAHHMRLSGTLPGS
jgi:epoxyqueuosine reductase QueG